ncbi:unnamed protein product [Rhizophagus irregularis]|nr:unnamed protein product [Rhizophagus irregularis]
MSYSQDSGEMNEINEYQQDEDSQETGETSSFFTRSRASSISDISGESASLSSITSKKDGANPIGPGKVMTCNLNNSEGQPCQRTYTAFGSTSNAIQHLASVHGIVEQGKIHIKAVKSGVIDQMIKNQNNKNKWTESQQVVADRKLAKWILNSTSPLDTVNNIYLNEFLAHLNPHYNLPNDKNLKLLIYQAYGWTEESMKELLNVEGDANNDFSNTITILDNDEDEEDEQEFLEQPEDDADYVLDPTTRTRVRINQAVNMEDIIEKVKEIILQALHKYWNVPSDIALKAAFLDPRFKDLTFARSKKDRIIRLIQDELNQVGNLLSEDNPNDENQGINETKVMERRGESPVINVLIGGSRRNPRKGKNTLFNRIFSKSSNTNAFENELNQYVNIKCANSDIDPCEWWAEKKQIFPLLSDLARKYLHIPATSVPSERLFSDTGNHVSVRRMRLDPNLLRTMVFLKRNMKAMDIFPPDE